MFSRHVSSELFRYCSADLPAAVALRIEAHLAECERCRSEREEVAFAAAVMRELPLVAPPQSVWSEISASLDRPKMIPAWKVPSMRLAAAATAILIAALAAYWVRSSSSQGTWEVTGSSGARTLAAGDWVNGNDRFNIQVGQIGNVTVEPGSRVLLGRADAAGYRLSLVRGTLRADITAPPRLFFVDTPAATVVDLGCAYVVTVDESGAGELHVTEGWASIEAGGRESLVPAGARARVRTPRGPGTPYFDDASSAFRVAVTALDAAPGDVVQLEAVLREARIRDTLTLWHLLSRTDDRARAQVYERIAELTPIPSGVVRERALALDAVTLRRWREELAWTW